MGILNADSKYKQNYSAWQQAEDIRATFILKSSEHITTQSDNKS